MYEQYTFRMEKTRSNDIVIHYAGNYGARGEKRAKKRQATPEQIQKQNQWKKETYVHRLIRANFDTEDYLFTLKWEKGARPSVEEVGKEWRRFAAAMRREYKKHDLPFKWIHRIEIGKRGGRHIHVIINQIPGENMARLVSRKWMPGSINCTPMYEQGNFKDLAEYMTKPPPEEIKGQLSMFETEEQKAFRKYSASRNLSKPAAEKKTYTRRTVRKIIEEGPKPTPGFYIDKNSIVIGVNQFTGYSYIRYTEYAVRRDMRGQPVHSGQLKGDAT